MKFIDLEVRRNKSLDRPTENWLEKLRQKLNAMGPNWTTGDVKFTYKNTADRGWVLFDDGSIGNENSGATNRANQDTKSLYILLWNNVADTWAPVSTGRGATALADFNANKTLTLPRALGRVLGVAGAGAGLTSRALGQYLGVEEHQLTQGELPSYNISQPTYNNSAGTGAGRLTESSSGSADTVNIAAGGSDEAHQNMPPVSFLNAMCKL